MAFNAMSNAYQHQTGSALCVADSYRSYPEQVAIKLERPGLAATPGTSQHGLGLAVDLCGGVQDFSAPAHLWMQRHAPLYGWFHPAWAEPSGVLPEPWHWEFAS
jgi:LAS superfamily LD-carboxypeptidase LdcB